MKTKPNPIQTEHHSKIILLLADGSKSLTDIAVVRDKEVSTISEQMDLLIEKGFVIKDDKPKDKRYKNSKAFFLNWDTITSSFLDYIETKAKTKFSTPLKIRMKINPYLKELLMRALKDHAEVFKKKNESKTIENIFEKITMHIIYAYPPHVDTDLIDISNEKDRKSFKSFLEFTSLMGEYLAVDYKDTMESFYEDIRKGWWDPLKIPKKNN